VRKRAEAAYRRITDRIDAYYVLNGGDATELFIKRINQEIAYFHEYNLSHHKTAIDRITVAPIPVQIYDGKPVVLIPDVSLEDTELVFARDYELTFKNNTRPGLARFTIRGKGAYRGRKTVSFNIAFDNPQLTIVNYQS
ncbi:MAG: hypothetical protein LBT42_03880, partial [Tannerella sp.]|nr:hypothetical protein [Tannerella sp.]